MKRYDYDEGGMLELEEGEYVLYSERHADLPSEPPDGLECCERDLRAAEKPGRRAPAEPVPPDGVTVYEKFVLFAKGGDQWSFAVKPDGSFLNGAITPENLEYAAALSRYRAAQPATGEQQRLEKALEEARTAEAEALRAHVAAEEAWDAARAALAAAREAVGAVPQGAEPAHD